MEYHPEYSKCRAGAVQFVTPSGRHVWEFTLVYGGRRVWVASMPDPSPLVKVQREDMPPQMYHRK